MATSQQIPDFLSHLPTLEQAIAILNAKREAGKTTQQPTSEKTS